MAIRYWLAGSDQQVYGPYTSDEIRTMVGEGRILKNSRLQEEGGNRWKQVKEIREFSDLFPGEWISADPAYVSSLVLSRPIDFDIGECIRHGLNVVKSDFWLCFGATAVVILASTAVSMFVSFVPFVGGIAAMFVHGPFYGGLWWFFLKKMRGEKAVIEDTFAGMQRGLPHLSVGFAIISLITTLIMFAVATPFMISFFVALVQAIQVSENPNLDPSFLWKGLGVVGILGIILAVLVSTFVGALWIFAMPIIVDKKLEFWPALNLSRRVVQKVWFKTFLLMLATAVMMFVGLLACCVGMFFTAPVAMAALTSAYLRIFDGPSTQLNTI